MALGFRVQGFRGFGSRVYGMYRSHKAIEARIWTGIPHGARFAA